MIYFDNAATSLIKPVSVEHAVVNAMRTMSSPGRGGHRAAMLAAETVFKCRNAAAELFNVEDTENIVFSFNATHALNMAINSLAKKGGKTVVSGFEHNSVTRPLNAAGVDIVTAGRRLFDEEDTLSSFESALNGASLAVCTYVSNVFGYILPIYEIAELCMEKNVPLIVDASQAAGMLEIDMKKLNAAFIAMPGHKGLLGPQGTGLLICNDETRPLLYGGTGSDSRIQTMPDYLPDRLEAGTHNVCGIAGLLEGINFVREKQQKIILEHEKMLTERFVNKLESIPEIRLFSSEKGNQSGVISLVCSKLSCEEIASRLSERDICTRAGYHCAPFAHESAATLDTGTVRFSFSPFNTLQQVDTCCGYIKELIS